MDELGVVSSWSVIELSPYISDKVGISDLNLNIGGRYKLLENFSIIRLIKISQEFAVLELNLADTQE